MTEKVKKKLNDSKVARWSVLLLVSFTMATNYYFYDALAPLADLIRLNLGFTTADYGLFISAYSVPNVFLAMAVIGGIILDRIGIRITGFTFVLLMGIGGAVTAYGASDMFLSGGFGYSLMDSFLTSYSPALKMMYLGFFIFGLGAETSIVVLSKVVVKWFKGKELALALGLNLGIGRLGAALALTLSPRLVHPEWTTAVWFGVLLLWIGLLAFIIYMFVDRKLDKQADIKIKDPEDEFHFRDLIDLVTNRSVIFITLLCVTFYSAVFPFIKFAPDLLMNKFSMARQMAGDVTSYLMYGTILLTPLFGWIADNKGKSATLMYLGSGLLIIAHLMFALTYVEPRIPIVLLGIAFSLVPAAMWPAVAKIVKESKLGTAYGFMFTIQNVGLWAFPMIIGTVVDASNPYYRTSIEAEEFEKVQEQSMNYKGNYMNRKQEPIKNKEINLSAVVFEDSLSGEIIWKESHTVKTNENGAYTIEIGKGDVLERVDFTQIVDTIPYMAEVLLFIDEDTMEVYDGELSYNENLHFISELSNRHEAFFGEQHEGYLTIYDPENDRKVWEEQIRFHVDEQGEFDILLAYGRLKYAHPDYFGISSGEHEAEIVKPLDYMNPMLVFATLGFFGLIFAFLLKREDKTSGYGLEQPNKEMKQ
ncbi:MAG: MFS transporter [Bacteroidales bacterium]